MVILHLSHSQELREKKEEAEKMKAPPTDVAERRVCIVWLS